MSRIALRALILILIGAGAGAAANLVRPAPIPWIYQQDQVLTGTMTRIDIEDAKRLFDEQDAVFVDARSTPEFDGGHIRGAKSLPYEEVDQRIAEFMADVPPETTLVVYCSGTDCMSSVFLAEALAEYGYASVRIFFGGWPEWKAAGYPASGGWN